MAGCINVDYKRFYKYILGLFLLVIFGSLTGCTYNQTPIIESGINQTSSSLLDIEIGFKNEFPLWKLNRENYEILFGGDVMLGRYVETLISRNGKDYPFQNLKMLMEEYDSVVVNLEGPFVRDVRHRQTPNGGFSFSFKEDFVSILGQNNISIVNLANNHSLNQGEAGINDTYEILTENDVEYFGFPNGVDNKTLSVNANGVNVHLIGFNLISENPPKKEMILDKINTVRKSEPNSILIVNFHFGNEYETTSSNSQKELTRGSIEAGADMIIGHHPHVVQEMEIYNGKPIFYSLGNLIFDQYFSKDVQEGLLVGMEIDFKDLTEVDVKNDPYLLLGGRYEVDKIEIEVIPFKSRNSQPYLLNEEEKRLWIKQFGEKSNIVDFDGRFEFQL